MKPEKNAGVDAKSADVTPAAAYAPPAEPPAAPGDDPSAAELVGLSFTPEPSRFPRVFWMALLLEFLERLAYYGVYVNLAVYLIQTVGLTPVENGLLMGVFAAVRSWVPMGTGALADRIGFRKSLTISFALYALSYMVLYLAPSRPGAWVAVMGMAVAGAFLKPVIPATVRRHSPEAKRAVGFSYFYASVNTGSVVGKVATKVVRDMLSLRASMLNAVVACVIGLGLTIAFFREPSAPAAPAAPAKGASSAASGATPAVEDPSKSVAKASFGADLLDFFKNGRLMLFLALISGYYLLIEQFYQTFPMYIVRAFGEGAPREYITLINPAAIAIFQVLVGKLTAKIPAPYAISLGVLVGAGAMLLMGAVPSLYGACGAFFVFAVAEMILSPRYYEYFSSFAPKGREAMYMGFAVSPVGFGGLVGGVLSGYLITKYLPAEGPRSPLIVWGTYAAIGVVCSATLCAYAMWVLRKPKAPKAA